MHGWLYVFAVFAGIFLLAPLSQLIRFLFLRIRLLIRLYKLKKWGCELRPLYFLWWLIDLRGHCNFIIRAGNRSYAVKLIPSLMAGTEYSIGENGEWYKLLNFLLPLPYYVPLMLDFGYRKMRPVKFNFDRYPGTFPVLLFHPHPYAIIRGLREKHKKRFVNDISELPAGSMIGNLLITDRAFFESMLKADCAGSARIPDKRKT